MIILYIRITFDVHMYMYIIVCIYHTIYEIQLGCIVLIRHLLGCTSKQAEVHSMGIVFWG